MRGKIFVLLSLAMLAGLTPWQLYAQVEKLPSDELKNLQKQLPQVTSEVSKMSIKPYLDTLAKKQFKDGGVKAIAIANAVRVAEDMKKSGIDGTPGFVYYAVRAMSDRQRLPDAYPADGRIGGEVRTVAAKDEFEAASFVLFPLEDMTVKFEVSDLKSSDGTILPKAKLDLKVVKVWMQNGNAWYSYFADVELVPVPELLLKDESLIKADLEGKANYAKVNRNGKDEYLWISSPRLIDSSYDEHGWLKFQTFRPLAEDFKDSKELQPVSLKAGDFKQMWLTTHIDKDTKEGLYRGAIAVSRNGKKIADIPVAVKVLPFELPTPKAYNDLNREYLVSLYSCPTVQSLMSGNGGDKALAEKQLLSMMKNMAEHNLRHPMINYGRNDFALLEKHLKLMKEAGLSTRPIVGTVMTFLSHGGDPLSEQDLAKAEEDAKVWADFYKKNLGHTDVYLVSGDEPPAPWVQKMRPAWKKFHAQGLKVFTAGHSGLFLKGGYIYDMHPAAGKPDDKEGPVRWNTVGGYTGFYADQHNGSENPTFVRRQHGLLGYLSGNNMIINYEFGLGPWNDRAFDLYKPMVLAYPSSEGLVDTIEWEAFREAVDDVRYSTLLKMEIERCLKSKNLDTLYAAKQVLQWYALLDLKTAEIDSVRADMTAYILKLRDMR